MIVEIDDDYLRKVTGARRKDDLGLKLEQWLYGDPRFDQNREVELGRAIVRNLVKKLRTERSGEDG